MNLSATARRGLKIAGVLALSLLGLALLPVLSLPYQGLDWRVYDPAYKQGYACPPTPTPTPEIPCAEAPGPGEPLAARVNGQGIGLRAFEREMAQFLRALEASGADLQSEEVQAEMLAFRRQVLDLLIDDVLVQQAAVEAGLTVADEEVVVRVAEEVAQGGGLEAFQTWLDETDQTWAEFEREVCQDLLRQAVMDHVTAGITGTLEIVQARQIVVATEAEAEAVLGRLASGEAFAVVAGEVSLDEGTRDRGGDLGWFPPGLGWVPPEVAAAAFAGAPGQVQGPIRAGETYVIVQTLDRQSDRPLDPDMRAALRAAAFDRWLAQRRAAAQIDIYVLAATSSP